MTDITARLDAAITAEREAMWLASQLFATCIDPVEATARKAQVDRSTEKFAALVAVREWYRASGHADCSPKACDIRRDKDAEAERLLGEDA